MRLRYFQTYDKDGVDSEMSLQYWNEEHEYWDDVNLVRVSEDSEIHYQGKDDMY